MKIEHWKKRKESKEKISMLTCYDYTLARVLDGTQVDAILVGDSSAMVIHGEANTISSTVEDLARMCSAVVKGAPNKFVVCDLPFGFVQTSHDVFIAGIKTIMSAGANAVKLEGFEGFETRITQLIQMGVPVMGHLGLMPQHIQNYGGFKVQGKSDIAKKQILEWALGLQDLGVFAIVLECIPQDLAKAITEELSIPTVGIGAGSDTDGQILVLHDFLGLTEFNAKFVRRYLNGHEIIQSCVDKYVNDVKTKEFPTTGETYD